MHKAEKKKVEGLTEQHLGWFWLPVVQERVGAGGEKERYLQVGWK